MLGRVQVGLGKAGDCGASSGSPAGALKSGASGATTAVGLAAASLPLPRRCRALAQGPPGYPQVALERLPQPLRC